MTSLYIVNNQSMDFLLTPWALNELAVFHWNSEIINWLAKAVYVKVLST